MVGSGAAMVLKLRIVGAGPGAPAGEPGPTADRVVELDDAIAEIRFGLRAGLEVELPFPALAPEHARMLRDGTGWVVEDLGSDAGTSVDGRPLERGGRAAIAPGQTLRLAHVAVRFEGAGAPARVGESTATLARRLVSDLFRATRQAQVPELVVLAGAFPGAASGACALRLVEPDRPYVVGRAETCDLVLPTDDVSREHAVIVRRWQGVHVRDLGSKNGVTMAGEPIGGERRLRDGDVIEVGSVRFRLDDPEDRYLRQLDAPSAPEPPVAVATPAPRPRARIGPLATAVSALVLLAIAAIALLLAL
jgi:pSer/pThr/pTyr-binding forkhead associated (FHA) protein